MKFLHIEEAKYLNDFTVWVRFSDGYEGEVDLQAELNGTIFQPLKEKSYFETFTLIGHTLTWPNGADFAPEYIRSKMRQTQTV